MVGKTAAGTHGAVEQVVVQCGLGGQVSMGDQSPLLGLPKGSKKRRAVILATRLKVRRPAQFFTL